MSAFFPSGLVQSLEITPVDAVLRDEFEDGSTSARRRWPASYFKRRFGVKMSPLTQSEWKVLRSFYAQRGTYDAFWFRDGLERGGNALVRFSSAIRAAHDAAGLVDAGFDLEEIAAIRALPEADELLAATGTAPAFWWDANRLRYFLEAGTAYPELTIWDAYGAAITGSWIAGSLELGNILGQYQHFRFSGTNYAQGLTTPALAGTQPAATLFAMVRHSSTSTKQILFSLGESGATGALGLQLNSSNEYTPWIGGSETWSTAKQSNGTADTWRSIALVWAASSNTVTLYVNSASVGSESKSRSYSEDSLTFGAKIDGSSPANPSNAMTNADINHVMIIPAALSSAQVKAAHNLLGYQYGLATVS